MMTEGLGHLDVINRRVNVLGFILQALELSSRHGIDWWQLV